MSSTTDIQKKFEALRKQGLDLGAKSGPEQDAGAGARVQVYQNGHIYWHPDAKIGTHEVHGGILGIYLRHGGPAGTYAGALKFGLPVSDETRTIDGAYPVSRFQYGDILWISGTGGVAIYGDFYTRWQRYGKEAGYLHYPIADPVAVAGGEAVFFERACMWKGPATGGQILMSNLHSYPLGNPALVDPAQSRTALLADGVQWSIPDKLFDQIRKQRPNLYTEAWEGRLWLQPVSRAGTVAQPIPLAVKLHQTTATIKPPVEPQEPGEPPEPPHPPQPKHHTVLLNLVVPSSSTLDVQDRTLYDLSVRLPNNRFLAVMPHAVYAKRSWADFGLAHITDLHVARRADALCAKVRQSGDAAAAAAFVNPNDSLRHLIRHANQLHDAGQLDLIVATGDLVDYIYDKGEPHEERGGNFELLWRLIRGQAPSPDPRVAAEELRVPIFMVRGNHDYRLNPYEILFKLHIMDIPIKTISQAGGYNLTDDEMARLQGGIPEIGTDGLHMLDIEHQRVNSENDYYAFKLAPCDSYLVRLGPHRLVMADAGPDAGIPHTSKEWDDLKWYIINNQSIPEDLSKAISGDWTNLEGYSSLALALVQQALTDAGSSGLVFIGCHASFMHIANSELNHYFRETEHPTADPALIADFLNRHDSKARSEWPTGTPYFKFGTLDDLLDAGVVRGGNLGFLRLVTGRAGARRPADLLLCGHNHKRVEWRAQADPARDTVYYMDFYTETPTAFYPSRRKDVKGDVYITVVKGVPLGAKPGRITDHRVDPPLTIYTLKVPPYPFPLSEALNKHDWWIHHRPLILETASLGPIDALQRQPTPRVPFQGFRVVQVKANVVDQIHYVTLKEIKPG